MKKYNNDYPKKLRNLLSSCINEGLRDLKNDGCTKKRKFSYITQLTEKGKQELAELYGLKKYLEDFSLIDERELKETMIWQQYMVYAALFGIADKVAKQLKKILPEAINEIEQYERNITCSDLCCYHMYNAMTRRERADAAKAVARASGSGGSASFGGGGGFSGGGFGGGTR